MVRRIVLLVVLLLAFFVFLASCAETTKSSQKSTTQLSERQLYVFQDKAVQYTVEAHFSKPATQLTNADLDKLANTDHLEVSSIDGESLQNLRDIPVLFPRLESIELEFDTPVSEEDCEVLAGMINLKAISISSPALASLDFLRYIDNANISYTHAEEVGGVPQMGCDLIHASVLTANTVKKEIRGTIKNYVRLTNESRVYEMLCTDYIIETDEFYHHYETKVLISEIVDDEFCLGAMLDVKERTENDSAGDSCLVDVDFDGNKDILVLNGNYGTQGLAHFTCFLRRGNNYEECESFTDIPNPSVNEKDKRILGASRGSANTHGCSLYSFVNGSFIETDSLTEELDKASTGNNEVWIYTVEKRAGDTWKKVGTFSEKDCTKDQIENLFFNDNNPWALKTEKWKYVLEFGTRPYPTQSSVPTYE